MPADDEIRRLLPELEEAQIEKLLDIARMMAAPIEEEINSSSGLLRPRFVKEFRARLQAHHATHTTPMDRLGFENAFLSASRHAGLEAKEAPSRTTRFYDVEINEEKVALKTEGAKSMKADRLHISKLSEAAWIQDMRSGRNRWERTMRLFKEFIDAVDRIFVLRYYRSSPIPRYELVEIPVTHFDRILELNSTEFDSDAPRIKISDTSGYLMELCLDRSDSKITIAKIEKPRCIVHGEWRLTQMEKPFPSQP